MTFITQIILLAVSTAVTLLSVLLVCCGRKEAFRTSGLSVFFLEELFGCGYILHRRFKGSEGLGKRREARLLEWNSPANAETIRDNAAAAPWVYLCLFLPLGLLSFSVTKQAACLCAVAVAVLFSSLYFDYWLNQTLKKRHAQLQAEFAPMLTKLSLMVSVGVTASEAFERTAFSEDTLLYREMQTAVVNMRNGMSSADALRLFTVSCPLREIKKFVSLYEQNLVKGGTDFPIALNEMADAAWEDRKSRARRLGETADQKLLGPTLCMFLGILLIVLVPAFQNLF